MNCKKLIEVAMPVKEISAESVRDKSIRHGHISTLHLWWARRPLPVCRAVVFASLVPDPHDENCPQQFKDAVKILLSGSAYKPYEDIPYTSTVDPMEDNLRNRLLVFIGKFSDKFVKVEKSGEGTCSPKETLHNESLIKWENKNNERILNIARKLIFVAHNASATSATVNSSTYSAGDSNTNSADANIINSNSTSNSANINTNFASTNYNSAANNNCHSESDSSGEESYKSCNTLLAEFDQLYSAIKTAESDLYETPNRHLQNDEIKQKEETLHNAIEAFLDKMPKVYDPFAGGGAIPLEAARLGCRTYANDLNPVAHIIEKASIEFPQKYGKPITYTKDEFFKIYELRFEDSPNREEQYVLNDNKTIELENWEDVEKKKFSILHSQFVIIKNRLSFDVEYYAKKLLKITEAEIGHFYPADKNGKKPVVYYWAKIAKCENPSCRAEIPMLKQFYISKRRSASSKDWVYFSPVITNKKVILQIMKGVCELEGWNNRGNLNCPVCGNVTSVRQIKEQSLSGLLKDQLIASIEESSDGKIFRIPDDEEISIINTIPVQQIPNEMMQKNSAGGDTLSWGITKWGDMFSNRQLLLMQTLCKKLQQFQMNDLILSEYSKIIFTYLGLLIDRLAMRNTRHNTWHIHQDTIEKVFGRQAISMVFDYPEMNPFSNFTSSAYSQLSQIVDFINEESCNLFSSNCINISSGENINFGKKYLDCVVTDPPYYDSIAYADLSDFFYVWLKRTLGKQYVNLFSTPQIPKSEECTALKHHHSGDYFKAKIHFEDKLKSIFKTIEFQTKDMVSIMFAHQSTDAWVTLCNSILNSNMNITGSWAIDTENTAGLKQDKAFLASSVTVSCLPAQREGTGDSKEVKAAIELKVKKEVEELYKLGFRGADLLTACFGPAVSEFGKYERVEKASGEEVTVEELLTWARDAAFNAIVSDIPTDDFTRFYIGWLNLFGFSETEHDDVRRITQIGLHLDVNELLANHLLIRKGNKQTLATFTTRNAENKKLGEARDNYTIDLVHKALYLLKNNNRETLLAFIGEHAQNQEDIFWRVANSLKEVLPKGMEDHKQVSELLANKDNLIKDSKTVASKLGEQEELSL